MAQGDAKFANVNFLWNMRESLCKAMWDSRQFSDVKIEELESFLQVGKEIYLQPLPAVDQCL